jgi:hypothetical protein
MTMNKKLLIGCVFLCLAGCEEIPTKPQAISQIDYGKLTKNHKYAKLLIDAEKKATPTGRKVLETGRDMALLKRAIVKGSCWDYANAVYEKAGFQGKDKRKVVLSKKQAARFDLKNLEPGDFLSYINHSYKNLAHSAIFVDWLNFEKKIALMLSYAGQNRQEPARYRPYELSTVFYVARAATPKPSLALSKTAAAETDLSSETDLTESEAE